MKRASRSASQGVVRRHSRRPRAAGRAQRPAAFVRRINNSEQNKRKSRNGSRSDALDGASADELHHRARDGAEPAPDRERDNADEIRAPASPAIDPGPQIGIDTAAASM
jgi:hypothetical protein